MIENLEGLVQEIKDLSDLTNAILGHSQMLLKHAGLDADSRLHVEEIGKAGQQLAEFIGKLHPTIGGFSFNRDGDKKSTFLNESGMKSRQSGPRLLEAAGNTAEQEGLRMQMPEVGGGATVLDISELARIIDAKDTKTVRELVELFIATARSDLSACWLYFKQGDGNALALSMHKLKSSAKTVGALRFAAYAENLEKAAREGHMANVGSLLVELEQALAGVETTLAGQLQSVTNVKGTDLMLPRCVLAIDDDPVVLRQIELLLASLGVKEVLTVNSAEKAVQDVERLGSRIDLLLCDLNMPEMDGIEFLRCISEMNYQGRIILVSGEEDRLLQTAAEFVGMKELHLSGCLNKPFTSEAFISLLQEPCPKLDSTYGKTAAKLVETETILDGLRNDEFEVYFQLKADAVTLRPVGVEALARWRRHGAIIFPDNFIPVAERHNLIGQLSEVLLTKAFVGASLMEEAGYPLSIAVNLSASWLCDVRIPDFIQASIHATGLSADKVILEITETGATADLTKALDIVTRLCLKGFKLSIDDFGTGYSSMEQLQRIPFNELKVDRTFVRAAASGNANALTILSSSIEMATKLKLTTVAEGVETSEQLELVRRLGCDMVQGWFIAGPMTAEELIAYLRANPQTVNRAKPSKLLSNSILTVAES